MYQSSDHSHPEREGGREGGEGEGGRKGREKEGGKGEGRGTRSGKALVINKVAFKRHD